MHTGVTYIEGTDGFPAFSISNIANLRSHYRLIVPEKLGEDREFLSLNSLSDKFKIQNFLR